MEIWLHNIKGQLEYEQARLISDALSGSGVAQILQWGPRMRRALEEDPGAILDWLCEVGALQHVQVSEIETDLYQRVLPWPPT